MALTSGTKLGPYEILSPLGAGGMGEVYRAKDTRLDRTVAIKVLPTHLSDDPELKQRMEREAKADIGTQDGTDFLVMEYLEGQTLAERLDPQEATITDARALLGVRDARLSPVNKRVAFAIGTGIWTLDLERKTKTRITFDQQVMQEPAWSADGKTILFSAQAAGRWKPAQCASLCARKPLYRNMNSPRLHSPLLCRKRASKLHPVTVASRESPLWNLPSEIRLSLPRVSPVRTAI